MIGWCDITRNQLDGFRPVRRLGMGVHAKYRGQGIGQRLLQRCLEQAAEQGVEKVEIEVFADNFAAKYPL